MQTNLDLEDFSDMDTISDDLELPRFGSVTPGSIVEVQTMKKQSSFAYLHENIDENKLNDPLMKKMPILKNIGKKNLIPVIDFESFNQSYDKSKTMQSTMSGKSDIAPQLTVNYLMVYLSGSLRCLSQ